MFITSNYKEINELLLNLFKMYPQTFDDIVYLLEVLDDIEKVHYYSKVQYSIQHNVISVLEDGKVTSYVETDGFPLEVGNGMFLFFGRQ